MECKLLLLLGIINENRGEHRHIRVSEAGPGGGFLLPADIALEYRFIPMRTVAGKGG